jgi:hypothetical protein
MFKTKRKKELEKVIKVFESCTTREHLEVAAKMGGFYISHYAPYSVDDLWKLNRVYALRYCQLGLHHEDEAAE